MTRPTVLITGASGLLGPYLVDAAGALGRVVTSARRTGDRPCDLTQPAALAELLAVVRPAVVLHTAALTDVDRCETAPAAATSFNCAVVAELARRLPTECRLLMLSTDQVYPDSRGPHHEDKTGPVNAYGRSKLAGERAALTHPGGLVARVNFFGPSRTPGRHSLSDFFAESFRTARPTTLFRDVMFSPLHMATLAELLVSAVARRLAGVFNIGCREGCSKKDFALALARHLGYNAGSARISLSSEIVGRAPRPRDLRMSVARFETALGRRMPTLEEEVIKL